MTRGESMFIFERWENIIRAKATEYEHTARKAGKQVTEPSLDSVANEMEAFKAGLTFIINNGLIQRTNQPNKEREMKIEITEEEQERIDYAWKCFERDEKKYPCLYELDQSNKEDCGADS